MQRTRSIILGLMGLLLFAGVPAALRLLVPNGSVAEEDEPQAPAATLPVAQRELSPTIVEPEGDWLSANQNSLNESEPGDEESLDNPLHHVAAPRAEESEETVQR